MPDCYDYVRTYYGVPAFIGRLVRVKDKEGVLVNKPGAGQYIYIKFAGDKRASGPFHPTDGIDYLNEPAPAQAS